MAWLLIQKAVHAGEITEQDASEQEAVKLDIIEDGGDAPTDLARLPWVARGLIDRSRRLYAHIESLKAGLGRGGAANTGLQ